MLKRNSSSRHNGYPIEIYCTLHYFQLHGPPVPGGAANGLCFGTWRDMGHRFANYSPVFGKVKIFGKPFGTSGKLGDALSSFAVALWLISVFTILARSPPLRHTYSSVLHHAWDGKMRSVSPLLRLNLRSFGISYITTPNGHMSSPKLCWAPDQTSGAK